MLSKPLKTNLAWLLLLCFLPEGHAVQDVITGQIGGLSNQLNQDVGNVPGNRYRGNFYFDYHKDLNSSFSKNLERRFSATAELNDENLTTYSIPEAYVGGMLTDKDHVRFGRQILPWSAVDSTWGFGKLNNRINFDYFTPGQEGLVGLLYERKSSNGMRYRTFVSGVYVPEMNPPLDIDNNDRTIRSRHPWADAPAENTNVQGNQKRIAYQVNEPDISEVVWRYSVGANLGFESKHWVWDNFFMRKPENQLSSEVKVNLDAFTDRVEAQVTPQVYYHDIVGSSVKYRNLDMEMYVSGMAVRPNTYPDGDSDATAATEIKTEKRREDYMGAGISKINDLYGMGLNYVARLSPFDRNKEVLAVDPRWNQAVNVFFTRNIGQSYSLLADVKYDMLTTDRLVMLRGNYKVSKELQMSIGMNMIGTPNDGKSFWSPYTNNDAVYAGLRYLF